MSQGTLLFDREGVPVSVLDCLTAEGLVFDLETGLVANPAEASHLLYWFGTLQRPEGYILTRSRETPEGILTDVGWVGGNPKLAEWSQHHINGAERGDSNNPYSRSPRKPRWKY